MGDHGGFTKSMHNEKLAGGSAEESNALALAWPRSLIADGSATRLAAWWVASRHEADSLGLPPIARHPMARSVGDVLFDARRARRLARVLEGAETLLAGVAGARLVASSCQRPLTGFEWSTNWNRSGWMRSS